MEETNDFDSLITTHSMKIIKAALPYIDISEQRFLSIYLKFSEFMNTIHLFSEHPSELSACKTKSSDKGNVSKMIHALRNVCDDKERETMDTILNFMQAMQLYQSYTDFFATSADGNHKAENSSTGNGFQNMDIMKALLTPEQQTMFETYKSLF